MNIYQLPEMWTFLHYLWLSQWINFLFYGKWGMTWSALGCSPAVSILANQKKKKWTRRGKPSSAGLMDPVGKIGRLIVPRLTSAVPHSSKWDGSTLKQVVDWRVFHILHINMKRPFLPWRRKLQLRKQTWFMVTHKAVSCKSKARSVTFLNYLDIWCFHTQLGQTIAERYFQTCIGYVYTLSHLIISLQERQ